LSLHPGGWPRTGCPPYRWARSASSPRTGCPRTDSRSAGERLTRRRPANGLGAGLEVTGEVAERIAARQGGRCGDGPDSRRLSLDPLPNRLIRQGASAQKASCVGKMTVLNVVRTPSAGTFSELSIARSRPDRSDLRRGQSRCQRRAAACCKCGEKASGDGQVLAGRGNADVLESASSIRR
jgi:hypothetical protein